MPKELPVDRKYALMIRDDEFNNYIEKSRQWLRNPNDETLTKEVGQLKQRVKDKWNARIHWPESTIQGVTDFWMLLYEPYKAVVDARIMSTLLIDEDGKITIASFKDNGLIHCPPDKIPIIINPTILTLHDPKTVKNEVWEIVKAEIGKRKKTVEGRNFADDLVDFLPAGYIKEKKTNKGRDFAVPAQEPEELATVLRCRPETFNKYLRWYDLKMEGGRRLSFRLIALIEFRSRTEDKEQKFREHINRKKKLRNIGPEKGESTIREGFNIIYRAINRESAPALEEHIPTSEKYDCPQHGENCSDFPDCAYREHWLTNFDNKNKMPSLQGLLSPYPPELYE
jgi:hypothetical protein